jgi:hypothetical protein
MKKILILIAVFSINSCRISKVNFLDNCTYNENVYEIFYNYELVIRQLRDINSSYTKSENTKSLLFYNGGGDYGNHIYYCRIGNDNNLYSYQINVDNKIELVDSSKINSSELINAIRDLKGEVQSRSCDIEGEYKDIFLVFERNEIIFEFVSVGESAIITDNRIRQHEKVVLIINSLKRQFETVIP